MHKDIYRYYKYILKLFVIVEMKIPQKKKKINQDWVNGTAEFASFALTQLFFFFLKVGGKMPPTGILNKKLFTLALQAIHFIK